MTIMLLPDNKVLILGALVDVETLDRIMRFMDDFLSNPVKKSAAMGDVRYVIDARCVPAIRIEVPK